MMLHKLLFVIVVINLSLVAASLDYNEGITDPYATFDRPDLVLPSAGESFKDPVFGTTIIKISSAPAGSLERHEYSQLQAFNKDSSLLLLDKDGFFVIRDTETLEEVFTLSTDINAPRWNPSDKEEIYHFDTNDISASTDVILQRTNVQTGITEDIVTFPDEYETVRGPQSWEELSRDGRWITAYLQQPDGSTAFMAYDIENDKFGAEIDETELYETECQDAPQSGPNWVAPSPLGNYMVIQWNADGEGFREDSTGEYSYYSGRCRGVEVYDIQTGEYVSHIATHRQHSDMGLDENGNEIYVTTEFGNSVLITTTQFPGSANFREGYDKIILDPGWFHVEHLSCQGPPGICVISAEGDTSAPFGGEIYLVSTEGSAADDGQNDGAQVLRLAHHRSQSDCGYYSQPQASMSEDGRYVIFASNWGSCENGDSAYMVELEDFSQEDVEEAPPEPKEEVKNEETDKNVSPAIIEDNEEIVEEAVVEETCQENWVCGEWDSCRSGRQNKVCIDVNECVTSNQKPLEERECVVEENKEKTLFLIVTSVLLVFIGFISILIIRATKRSA